MGLYQDAMIRRSRNGPCSSWPASGIRVCDTLSVFFCIIV